MLSLSLSSLFSAIQGCLVDCFALPVCPLVRGSPLSLSWTISKTTKRGDISSVLCVCVCVSVRLNTNKKRRGGSSWMACYFPFDLSTPAMTSLSLNDLLTPSKKRERERDVLFQEKKKERRVRGRPCRERDARSECSDLNQVERIK